MTKQLPSTPAAGEAADDRHFVTALARGLAVLAAFRPGEAGLGNQQLAGRTGLPKSSVSRLCHTLTRLGYLSHDADSGNYHPGPAALTLSSALLGCFDIRRTAGPLMRAFAQAHTISVSLGMLDGSDIVYLETCRSSAPVSVQLTLGSRVPLATTAIGRACYAGLAPADRAELQPLLAARYRDDWPALATSLDEACADFRRYGYCMSFGDFEADVMAVGVPLPAPGQTPMCLNASGPAYVFDRNRMTGQIGPALLALRDRIMPPR